MPDVFFFFFSLFTTAVPIIIIVSVISTIKASRKGQKVSRQYHAPKASTTNGIHNDDFSHEQLNQYAQNYANVNSVKDSGIKDPPMSEAERNVFYGK